MKNIRINKIIRKERFKNLYGEVPKGFYTLSQLSQILGYSKSFTSKLVNTIGLKAYKFEGNIKHYRLEDILEHIRL